MTTTTARLNLREGAGTNYEIIKTLPSGTTVTVTGGPTNVSGTNWYQVVANGDTGWVSGAYLKDIALSNTGAKIARDALLTYLHIPYIWGGQSRSGLDCSGLVGEWWEDIGFRPEGFDTTADKLYDGYRTGTLPGTKLSKPQFGALAFYGSGTNAGHVVICYDDVTVIGANGACVRLDRIDYRNDLLGIWMPAYGWS